MVYFDNSATTIAKPPEVAEAVSFAINNFGNAGRSFYDSVMLANREIYRARQEIAGLIGLDEPLSVAFTSSATESLNLVISSLIGKNDRVITSVTEHNSVLRPLYLTGCKLDFIGCEKNGNLLIDSAEKLIKASTKFMVITHGSNVTGNITDVYRLYDLCKKNGILLILDISQTLGVIAVDFKMADIFCFTGHKGLFGPQGTGGIIAKADIDFRIVKTGGAGFDSFSKLQGTEMPDVFESGTLNSHGIFGLQKAVQFVRKTGIDEIEKSGNLLTKLFYENLRECGIIRFYGDFETEERLPIVSLNLEGIAATDFSAILWDKYKIATRAGIHCAPLLHKEFNTENSGIVRFSFSYFNTEAEILFAVGAIKEIIKNNFVS